MRAGGRAGYYYSSVERLIEDVESVDDCLSLQDGVRLMKSQPSPRWDDLKKNEARTCVYREPSKTVCTVSDTHCKQQMWIINGVFCKMCLCDLLKMNVRVPPVRTGMYIGCVKIWREINHVWVCVPVCNVVGTVPYQCNFSNHGSYSPGSQTWHPQCSQQRRHARGCSVGFQLLLPCSPSRSHCYLFYWSGSHWQTSIYSRRNFQQSSHGSTNHDFLRSYWSSCNFSNHFI